MGKHLSNKYRQKILDSVKKCTTDALKPATHATKVASERAIQRTQKKLVI